MSASNKTMISLGYLGLIPFAFGLIMTISNHQLASLDGAKLFTTYSAVILSFLSGVLWGSSIISSGTPSLKRLLIASNVFALVAWLALLLNNQNFQLTTSLLTAGYVSIWFLERQHLRSTSQDKNTLYMTMRSKLTTFVVLMHMLAIFIK